MSLYNNVLHQQIQALEQIKNNQRHLYSQEGEPRSNKRPTEMWPMKNNNTDNSSHNYNLVDSYQPWKEEDAIFLTPRVSNMMLRAFLGRYMYFVEKVFNRTLKYFFFGESWYWSR